MARRVNTSFVIVLSLVLVAIVGLVGWQFVLPWLRERDPVYQAKMGAEALKGADDAEQRGDDGSRSKQLELALVHYSRAAGRAEGKHLPEAAEYWTIVGKLYYRTSDRPERWEKSMAAWRKALAIRPTYKPAEEQLIKQLYDRAQIYTSVAAWADVEKEANAMLKIDANYALAYRYRGEAIVGQLSVGKVQINALTAEKQNGAKADLLKAIEFQPDDPVAYQVLTAFLALQASAADQKTEAASLREEAIKLIVGFCEKHPQNAKGWLALATLQQSLGQLTEAAKAYDRAREANPKDPEVPAAVGTFFATQNKRAEAEKCYRAAIELEPNDANGYYRLAMFYRSGRQSAEAVEQFKQVLAHRRAGIGATHARNERLMANAYYELSQSLMDIAESTGAATPVGTARMTEAAKYIEEFRAQAPSAPSLHVLDGRLFLLRGQTDKAMAELKQANDLIGSGSPSPVWLQMKLTYAVANVRTQQWGRARELYTQIIDVVGDSPMAISALVERGRVHTHNGDWDKALADARTARRIEPGNAGAIRLEIDALFALGQTAAATALVSQIQGERPEALITVARMHLVNEEYQEAIDTLDPVFARDPADEQACQVAAAAWMLRAEKSASGEEAKAFRAKALELVGVGLGKRPTSPPLLALKARVENPTMKTEELQQKLIADISDEYDRNMAWSDYYGGRRDTAKQIDYLMKAEEIAAKEGATRQVALQQVTGTIFRLALATMNKDLARRYADKAERLNLDGVNGNLYKGQWEFIWGDKTTGLQMIKSAVSTLDSSESHTILGQAYVMLGQPGQARDELVKAVDLKPGNLVAVKAAIRVLASQADHQSQDQARRILIAGLKVAPGDRDLRAMEDVIGDPKESIRRHEAIRKIRPDDMDNLRRLGFVYVRSGDRPKAIDVFKVVYSKYPDDHVIAGQLAHLYQENDQPGESMKILTDLVANPDPAIKYQGLLLMGDLHRNGNHLAEAKQLYGDAVKVQPKGMTDAERRIADMAFDAGDVKAEGLYKDLSDRNPSDLPLLRRYIESVYRQGKFDQGDEILQSRILKEHPDDQEGLVLKGYALLRRSRYNDAINVFDKVIQLNSENADARYFRASSTMAKGGDLQQAIDDLVGACTSQPNRADYRVQLARAYRMARRYPEAVHAYTEVVNTWPALVQPRVEYADFLHTLAAIWVRLPQNSDDEYVRILRQIQPVETLTGVLQDSIKRFPTQGTWLVRLGNLYWLQERKDLALQAHEQAMGVSKASPEASIAYLSTLISLKYYERAVQVSTTLLTQYPDATELYLKRGTAYAGWSKQTEAVQDFTKALGLVEKNIPVHDMVARQMIVSLPKGVAAASFAKSLEADPKSIPYRLALATAQAADERYDQAEATAAPLAAAENTEQVRRLALRVQSNAALQAKQYPKARDVLLAILKIDPDDLESLNDLAYILAVNLNQPAEGLKYAEHAVNVLRGKPVEVASLNTGNVYDTYGWVKYLNTDLDGASAELLRSIQADPLPVGYYHLAKVQQAQRHMSDAKRNATEAVRLAAERKDPILADAKALLEELNKP